MCAVEETVRWRGEPRVCGSIGENGEAEAGSATGDWAIHTGALWVPRGDAGLREGAVSRHLLKAGGSASSAGAWSGGRADGPTIIFSSLLLPSRREKAGEHGPPSRATLSPSRRRRLAPLGPWESSKAPSLPGLPSPGPSRSARALMEQPELEWSRAAF